MNGKVLFWCGMALFFMVMTVGCALFSPSWNAVMFDALMIGALYRANQAWK